jgi:hypothetical protein
MKMQLLTVRRARRLTSVVVALVGVFCTAAVTWIWIAHNRQAKEYPDDFAVGKIGGDPYKAMYRLAEAGDVNA